jgi:hypothetical protein
VTARVSAVALVVAASAACGRRGGDAAGPLATEGAAPSAPIQVSPVFVANHGKLVGAFNGFAWVAGSEGTRIDMPDPCNERGCFRGTDGVLCARGTVAAVSCSGAHSDACRRAAWGVKIGLDVRRDGGPWGSGAQRYVAIEYRGAKRPRVAAHRAGDGDREYCVDGYRSGELVRAEQFRMECWQDGGDVLAGFDGVDKFILELPAPDEATAFDYCITAIRVGDEIDAAGAPADAKAP